MIVRMSAMIIALVIFAYITQDVYGHGIGFERLPAQKLGDEFVALEVLSSQYTEPGVPDREIRFTLFDNSTGITIRDVVFHIKAEKSGHVLFEEDFVATNGEFVFVLLGGNTLQVEMIERNMAGFLDRVIGLRKDVVEMRSSLFNTGGLYTFEVRIMSADSNILESPIHWNVGLSIPDITRHVVNDPYFGKQEISIITYYDEIANFDYEPRSKTISFTMPFEWDVENINETPIVHEEFAWSKEFGDLMVSEFVASVNGHTLSNKTITIDDLTGDQRTVHVIINKKNLMEQYETYGYKKDLMKFVLIPASNSMLQTVTNNGEFRLTLETEPKDLVSNEEVSFTFDIEDVFTRSLVEVDYNIKIIGERGMVFQTSGTSKASELDRFSFHIPPEYSGILYVVFENINGIELADASFGIIVDRDYSIFEISDNVRNKISGWSNGLMTDEEFVKTVKYLLEQGIVRLSDTQIVHENLVIPDWMRDTINWWSNGLMTDEEFVQFIQYVIKNDIMTF